jgi:DivIVA domain-containing protein
VTWFFAVLIVLALGAVAVVAAGRGASMGPAYDDRADVALPGDRPVTGDDLRALRFNTALRGYRADEVDALIDHLAAQLDEAGEVGHRPQGSDFLPEPPEDEPH